MSNLLALKNLLQSPELIFQEKERRRCKREFAYFADTYCHVLSETGGEGTWIRFRLWDAQREVADTLQAKRLVVLLKARQLGMTWLVLAFVLWLVIFHPIATVLLFSRRDDEAVDLLKNRLRGMHARLPDWMRQPAAVDNDHEWELSNGSRVLAFPTTAGDSYTATLAVVDEADLVPNLERLMGAVKPTIDGGGRMILLSRPDKSKPESAFKRIYRAARQKLTEWWPIFLSWRARPDRDDAWHKAQADDVLHRTGSLDDLHEQYPGSDVEAMAPRTMDKRIAPAWLQQCWAEQPAIPKLPVTCPAIPGLRVFRLPVPARRYIVSGDPAEGNPTSDDSAADSMEVGTGEQVATLAGKFQPSVLAGHIAALARYYNQAAVMVERNNHGHAVLLALRGTGLRLLTGKDGKEGWLSSQLGKTLLYDACADQCRNGEVMIHDMTTFAQLSSIDGSSLRAPDGQNDDRADAFALCCVARPQTRAVVYRGPRK